MVGRADDVTADAPRSILVINVTRIGDTLYATPALRALTTHWPSAEITVLAHPKRAEVLENFPDVARIGRIEKRRARFMGWLPGRRYDLAVVFGHDAALLRYALRVSRRVVAFHQDRADIDARLFRSVAEKPASFPPGRPPLPHRAEHPVDQALRLIGAVGVPPGPRRLVFALRAEERSWAESYLNGLGLADHRPLIGMQVASFAAKSFRDWPIENFADFGRRIATAFPGAGFLIFGGPAEQARTAWLAEQFGSRARSLAGKLSLRQTAALMSRLHAYVGVDTGPTHLMSTFDIPMVGLYHSHFPRYLAGPLDHPLDFSLDHPRCGRDSGTEAPMAELSVDSVYERLCLALSALPQGGLPSVDPPAATQMESPIR
jgi:heptosyltransferase-3